jgi:hypothetical protein
MKLLYSVYMDECGRRWKIEQVTVPTRKSTYSYYLAECLDDKNLSFRENQKGNVMRIIQNIDSIYKK